MTHARAHRGLPSALHRVAGLVGALTVLAGCTVPVVNDADDGEANRIVSALTAVGIAADRAAEPGSAGHFRVEVPRDDAARAAATLADEGLPSPPIHGVLDALGTSSLVPSRTAEHERLLAGIAGDLERTIGAVDGVLSARVHLAVPRADPLALEAPSAATASVLIRHRGTRPPLSEVDVRRLLAGAVPGLLPDRIAVVDLVAPAPPARSDVVRVGPLSLTRAVAAKVRLAVAGVAIVNLLLVSCLLVLWARVRRLRPRVDGRGIEARDPS